MTTISRIYSVNNLFYFSSADGSLNTPPLPNFETIDLHQISNDVNDVDIFNQALQPESEEILELFNTTTTTSDSDPFDNNLFNGKCVSLLLQSQRTP